MAATPEELALALSIATFEAQRRTETKLRERATNVLSAASIAMPVAAVALGRAPAIAAVPFGGAALAYICCATECCRALFPRGFVTGIAGGRFLEEARKYKADVRQMEATAAGYLDRMHEGNLPTLEATANQVKGAIISLIVEIGSAAIALVVTLLS
jgi:hypothetical protein